MSEQNPHEQHREDQPKPAQPYQWNAPPQENTPPPRQDGNQPEWNTPPQWNAGPPGYGAHQQWGYPYAAPHGGQQPGFVQPGFSQPGYVQPGYVAPPKPGVVPLRPLLFGEILDGSFQTIRRNATAMLGAALLAQTLGTIIGAVFTAQAGAQGESLALWLESLTPTELVGLGLGVLAGGVLLTLVSYFISIVLQGVMVVPVARSVLNRRTSFRQMWSLSRSRIGPLLGLGAFQILAWIAVGVVLVGGTWLLADAMGGSSAMIIVPFVLGTMVTILWVTIRLIVTPAAIVVEEQSLLEGLRRSWRLTRHNWWRIFGMLLVISLLIGIISQIVLIPISLATGGLSSVVTPHGGDDGQRALAIAVAIASILVSAVVGAVGYAFQTSVLGLVYMDLRMRKEGLDLALLRELESDSGSSPNTDGVPGRGVAPEDRGRPAVGGWPNTYGPTTPYGPATYGPTTPYGPPPGYEPPNYGPPPGAG